MKKTSAYSAIQVEGLTTKKKVVKRVVRFKKLGCKYYFNAQHIFLQLPNKGRVFFDFLCENMDTHNRVTLDLHFKKAFIDFIKEITVNKTAISLDSVDQFILKLKKLGLIFTVNDTKAYYAVNPKYAYKGSEETRLRLLKSMIEKRLLLGLPIDMLIGVSTDDFLGTN